MLIQRASPKIPKALLNAPEEYLQQRIQDKYGYYNCKKTYSENSVSQATERALLKYYPKYCHTVRLDNKPKPHPILHRIKQIKTLRHFEYDLGSTNKDLIIKILKKLLINKRKSLKSLPVIGFEKEQCESQIHHITIIEMCSFFPQIKTLNLYLPSSQVSYVDLRSISRPLKKEVLESYGRFWDFLKSLKHLEISVNLPNFSAVIPYLQRAKRFLTSLQSFRLRIEPKCYRRLNQTAKLFFQASEQSPRLLESITHVDFHRFNSHMRKEFSGLWELFTSSLKCLNNLRELNLRVYEIKAFEFPLKLKKLALFLENFHSFDSFNPKVNLQESETLWSENDDVNEEKSQTPISKFVEKFNNLVLLTYLEINMDLFTYPNDILKTLIAPLLQRTPKLEKFEWNLSQGFAKNICSLEFSLFLESLTSHKQLQSFKISQPVLDDLRLIDRHGLLITFSPYKIISFPNISSVNIEARISEDFDFRSFFSAFSEGSHFKKEISLSKIHARSIRSFIKLIKIFKEAEQLPRMRINLEIVLCVESLEEIERNFQETIIPAKNVFIDLKIYVSSLDKTNFRGAGVETLQRVFRKMNFSMNWLVKEKVTVFGYEQTACIPMIKNNCKVSNDFFN